MKVTDGFLGDTQLLVEENACAVVLAGLLGVGALWLCHHEAGEDVLFSFISRHSLPPKQPVLCWILFSWVFVCCDSFRCLVSIFFDPFYFSEPSEINASMCKNFYLVTFQLDKLGTCL